MNRAPNLLTEQLARVALRSWLLLHGVASGVFWALFLTTWTLLSGAGFGWVGWVMLSGYVVVAAPFLIIQLVLIADLLAYVVIGKIFAYPAIDRIVSDYAKADANRARRLPWTAHLILFLADASPLSSLAKQWQARIEPKPGTADDQCRITPSTAPSMRPGEPIQKAAK